MTSPLATISPLARRIRLARDIVRLRVATGMTQTDLAKAIASRARPSLGSRTR